jgi:hypothetical protein
MALNQTFLVKNNFNTLGNILSAGTNLTSIFAAAGAGAATPNAITFNNGGSGGASGLTFDGSSAKTVSYNTIGASPLAGSSSLTTVGTIASGTWNGNTIGLGYGGTGATTAQGAINALAGATTNTYYLRGNGTNVTMSAIQASDVPTLNQNTTGSAASLTTSHTLWGQTFNGTQDIIGNLTGVGNITGSSGITISTASNGNITLSPNGTGIVTTAASFQAASANFTGSVSVGQDLSVAGSLYFGGSAIQLVQGELVINAPIVYMGESNPSDSLDIGFAGHYVSGSYAHTGLLRSNSTKNWYLFSSMVTEPSANSVASNTKTIDTLVANTSGSHTGNATTATTLQTSRNFTATGDVTTDSAQAFNGSAAVTLPLTIANNAVTLPKLVNATTAYSVLGNNSASTGVNYAAVTFSAIATQLNLNTNSSAQFGDVTVGTLTPNTINSGTAKSDSAVYSGTTASGTSLYIDTFNFSTSIYKAAKYVVRVSQGASGGTASALFELLVNYDPATTNWVGTVYGVIDPSNILNTNFIDIVTNHTTNVLSIYVPFVGGSNLYYGSVLVSTLV